MALFLVLLLMPRQEKPLQGANIVVDGTDLGSAADEEGRYAIEGVEPGSSITASAIGYDDLTLYADESELNFELSASKASNV